MNIAIIGAGYVGMTTAACLAELGHNVCCVDVDSTRIDRLARADIPIFEPGLNEIIEANIDAARLHFTSDLKKALINAAVVFVAVGTPSDEKGDIDLSYVETAAADIAPHLRSSAVVVIKSTVAVGTARRVATILARQRGGRAIAVASNPEFLREGSALNDFMNADRIVVGADDPKSLRLLARIYEPLIREGTPFIQTTSSNAELIKYAANAFLALKIGFINDVANICENADANVDVIAEGIGLDSRIGKHFLSAGPGFGGSCFPKDARAFAAIGRRFGAPQDLIETLIEKNEIRKADLAHRILDQLGSEPGRRVAVLGTAFKANTDDMREAAALTIIPILQRAGVKISAHDPKARKEAERHLRGIDWHQDPYDAARGADLLVVLTEWAEYGTLDLAHIAGLMRGRAVVDYRNIFACEAVVRAGLDYTGLGRPKVLAMHTPFNTPSAISSWGKAAAARA
jgi:UDPglucose 6-dehydrogenase